MYVVLHLLVWVSITHKPVMFQVFQLTAFVIRGPATRGERFLISLDRVPVKEEEVPDVLICVQVFVWSPHFTQRSFLSGSGLTMLSESVAITHRITSSSVFAPWSLLRTVCASHVVSDLCSCWDRVVLRRRTAINTSERWYHGGTSGSQTASKPGVQTSDVVEELCIEYVPVASPPLAPTGPSKIRSSPSKRKRKVSRIPVKMPRKFEISSLSAFSQKRSVVEEPSFASALTAQASRGKPRRSRGDRRAAPVFRMGFHRNSLL